MKTREGFVSNSSSTSFIIAVPKGTKEVKGSLRVDADLLHRRTERASTEEELKQTIFEYYDDEELANNSEYDKCKDLVENGYDIVEITVSDDDWSDRIGNILCYEGLNDFIFDDDRIEIIRGDGGY